MGYDSEADEAGYNNPYGASSSYWSSSTVQAYEAGQQRAIEDQQRAAQLRSDIMSGVSNTIGSVGSSPSTSGWGYGSCPSQNKPVVTPPPLTEKQKAELRQKEEQERRWKAELSAARIRAEKQRKEDYLRHLDAEHEGVLKKLEGYEAVKAQKIRQASEFASKLKLRQSFAAQAFSIDPTRTKSMVIESSGKTEARDRRHLNGPSEYRKQRGFGEGTEIWTGKRLQSIETIEDGQDICLWDRYGERYIFGEVKHVEVRLEPIWEIEFEGNPYRAIRAAKDQPLWTVKGWNSVCHLASKSAALEMCDVRRSIALGIKRIAKTDEIDPVYNVITEKNFSYVANSILAVSHIPPVPFLRIPRLLVNTAWDKFKPSQQ